MKLFIYSALAATLCAAPVLAQPQDNAKMFPPKVIPRQGEVNLQIKEDMQNFAREFNGVVAMEKSVFNGYDYVYGARPGIYGASAWAREVKYSFGDAQLIVDGVQVQEQVGDEAQALLVFHFEFLGGDNEDADFVQMQLPREEQVQLKLGTPTFNPQIRMWQIVPPDEAPPALVNIFASPLTVNLNFWANVAYYLSQRHPFPTIESSAMRSRNNLKQLGLGALQLVQDYNEIYAFDPRYQIEAIKPYIGDPAIFQIPDTNEIYTFNGNLSGLTIDKVKAPAQTVLFYEGRNETPIFRYDGRAAICFADGHVALVSPDEAKKMIWKP